MKIRIHMYAYVNTSKNMHVQALQICHNELFRIKGKSKENTLKKCADIHFSFLLSYFAYAVGKNRYENINPNSFLNWSKRERERDRESEFKKISIWVN